MPLRKESIFVVGADDEGFLELFSRFVGTQSRRFNADNRLAPNVPSVKLFTTSHIDQEDIEGAQIVEESLGIDFGLLGHVL